MFSMFCVFLLMYHILHFISQVAWYLFFAISFLFILTLLTSFRQMIGKINLVISVVIVVTYFSW